MGRGRFAKKNTRVVPALSRLYGHSNHEFGCISLCFFSALIFRFCPQVSNPGPQVKPSGRHHADITLSPRRVDLGPGSRVDLVYYTRNVGLLWGLVYIGGGEVALHLEGCMGSMGLPHY